MTIAPNYQVVLLTGQSDPQRCALSPLQQAFLDRAVPRDAQLRSNFPYSEQLEPYRATPLLIASWRNGRQYFASRHRSFAHKHAGTFIEVIERCERTLVLTGSCG